MIFLICSIVDLNLLLLLINLLSLSNAQLLKPLEYIIVVLFQAVYSLVNVFQIEPLFYAELLNLIKFLLSILLVFKNGANLLPIILIQQLKAKHTGSVNLLSLFLTFFTNEGFRWWVENQYGLFFFLDSSVFDLFTCILHNHFLFLNNLIITIHSVHYFQI